MRPIACESLEIIEMTPMSCRTFSAAIVSARTRLSANATSDGIFGIEVVADHDHVEQLGLRVDAVRQRRVGRAGQDVVLADDLEDVRGVTAAGAFGVVGVDRPAFEGGDRVLDVAGLVERVGVDGDLDVHIVGDRQRRRIAAGVVPQSSWILRPAAPAQDLLLDGGACRRSCPCPGSRS